ncbi:regulator of microtubule dynamics protein 1-like isoform X2 [Lycorma delicatula]
MPLNEKELDEKTRRDAIKKADDLFTANKHEEVCEALSDYKDSGDVEVLWRIARSKYKLSSQPSIAKDVKESVICEGYDVICRALEIDEKHYAVHKWMSVLLDARNELRGTKERITQLEKVKEHMLEAVKLNPNDATTYHMLGSWCYQIADMAWYQRKIAAALFANPPTSTFQEALQYFKQAEEVQPNFYSQNLLMLGKTYLKLGEQERAYYYLKLTTEYLVSSDDDLLAHNEAETLLKKVNYKAT